MKRSLIFIFILVISIVLIACNKDVSHNAEFKLADNYFTYIKFIHAYPYATPSYSIPANGPTIQLTYNNAQFSATPISLGGTFPASPGYAASDRGITITDLGLRMSTGIPPAAVKDSFLFTTPTAYVRGKYYSYFFVDSIPNSTKRMLVVEDDIKTPNGPSLYRIRFVNLLLNMPTATPVLDLYSTRAKSVIFTGIPSRGVTPFIELPIQGVNTPDTLQLRYTGSSTALATLNTVSLQGQISLTVFARGLVGATGTRAPGISTYRNR
jgi:hypothetical protein